MGISGPRLCASISLGDNSLGGSCFVRIGDAMLFPAINHVEKDCSDCSKVLNDV